MKVFRYLNKCALAITASFGLATGAFAQAGFISTVVGGGPSGLPAVTANLYQTEQLAIDAQGNYYFADYQQARVYKVTASTKVITVVAGTGFGGYSGDGGLAIKANLNGPQGVAVDGANPANIYVADTNNCLVRKVSQSTGIITTIAGLVTVPTSGAPYSSCGYAGDGGQAKAAELYYPIGLAFNTTNSDIYIADYQNGRIRKVAGGTPTGTITTVAGGGGSTTSANNCQGTAPFGDTGLASNSYLCYPTGVAIDSTVSPANVFASETNSVCDIREIVGSSKKIYQIAGSYTLGCGFTDNVKATSGQLYYPQQIFSQTKGGTTTLSVADYYNNRIRQFTLTYSGGVPVPGTIVTIAGDGQGYSGDNSPALSAGISNPRGFVIDASGNFYISGENDNRIREVLKSNGYINTVAGWGQTSYSDPVGVKNVLGGEVSLYQPYGLFADLRSNDVWLGGYSGQAAYVLNSATSAVSGFAGNGVAGFAGDGTAANGVGAELNGPIGVVKDSSGNVYIADYNNCAIREVVASTGKITTIAGGNNGTLLGCGYNGDNQAATSAQLNGPEGLAIDVAGNIYIADSRNCLVRKILNSNKTISTVAGLITHTNNGNTAGNCAASSDGIRATLASLYNPTGVAVDGARNIYIADYYTSRIRKVDSFTNQISTVAGNGRSGYSGDGPALSSSLYNAELLYSDINGNLFISDKYNSLLRWVDPGGQMVTFAGSYPGSPNGNYGFGGDGGAGLSALLAYPEGIGQDAAGNFYFVDTNNQRIRKVNAFAGFGRSTNLLNFGNQPAGTTSQYQSITISAIGPTNINTVNVVGAGFNEIDDCAGTSLIAGQTCEIDVFFSPATAGFAEATINVVGNNLLPQNDNIFVRGTGTGLTFTGSLAFGPELLSTPVTHTFTVTNGGAAITVSKIYLTQTTDFSISGGSCPINGGTLAGGASCTVNAVFSPKTIGAKKSTFVLLSNDAAGPLLEGITGTGTEVKLSSTSLAFGTVTHGQTKILNLTVTNTGTNTLTIGTSIAGSGASEFSVLSAGNTCKSGVAAGKSCTLPVQYGPAPVGSFAATLTLNTNGGSNPSVALSGTSN